ncbi:type V CRISPR-associated protein Cas12k [Calothrix sp. PCC 6303]|uniref:type V CRISPR-associated protein Cas12k n=1 Tax=Calothrix sp. PCC 6303 TaxID=1170562 RepID=UPI0002A02404|nr:type V CRISPR-associated protein Cas12k [Calothrix sp. PCC 6303]AFZ00435.1 hypothetical protein Cal6303_1382 [Calothrix sp. PCC 6303]
MSVITIQCRLVADEETLRHLWTLMAEKNTPFANEILEQLAQHAEFESWVKNSRVPATVIKELCDSLKNQELFAGQPGRFYTSATTLVTYIYKSWLAVNKRLQRKIEGKKQWLDMLRSDTELEQESNSNLEKIRAKATEILDSFATRQINQVNSKSKTSKNNKNKQEKEVKSLSIQSNILFETYRQTEDNLTKCAIVYLLKNNCEVNDVEEDIEEYEKNKRKKEIQIKRLEDQLKSRVPKGRDLTGEKWVEVLEKAVNSVPESENEAKSWQASLLRKSSQIPFPVVYETNEDIKWSINEKGRIFVSFNGLGKLKFEIFCDKRHLHYFQRFLEDQDIKRQGKNQHSSSLFTLRSGRISWLEQPGKGKPWNINRLLLFCSIDTRMLTAEGTQQVIEEKIADTQNKIAKAQEKCEGELNPNQQAHINRKKSTLARINTPFPRPSKPLYQGKSHIVVGVSLGLKATATIAVFDAMNNQVLAYRSTKQLLGDNYKLLNRQQQQKQRLSQQRHKSQKQFASNSFGESELGQYVDRLLAKEIVAVAKNFGAGSIVLPKLGDMREIIQSEVQAKAEKKIPGFIELQKNYAKEYRKSAHNWSYGRLIENIQSQATKEGIEIETGKQPTRGIPQEQARDLALFAYQCRIA